MVHLHLMLSLQQPTASIVSLLCYGTPPSDVTSIQQPTASMVSLLCYGTPPPSDVASL